VKARIAPTREGYVNAIQVCPFTDGALPVLRTTEEMADRMLDRLNSIHDTQDSAQSFYIVVFIWSE
jgi:hypothetical protein